MREAEAKVSEFMGKVDGAKKFAKNLASVRVYLVFELTLLELAGILQVEIEFQEEQGRLIRLKIRRFLHTSAV